MKCFLFSTTKMMLTPYFIYTVNSPSSVGRSFALWLIRSHQIGLNIRKKGTQASVNIIVKPIHWRILEYKLSIDIMIHTQNFK